MKKEQIFFLIFCLTSLAIKGYSQEDFHLTIERELSSNQCTMGYLIADGEVICYTLELPWVDNKNNISCIPVGTYNGILRYDKLDGWRIQLEAVPDRTGVQIHIGNYTREIHGCILVGKEANINECTVQRSSMAYSALKEKFYGTRTPNKTPNKKITLTFK